ncbi:MAG: glycosyltransferase [Deltaproteobacteria bacterium]|nr:glycosyltransferase [Deltaproteobacteria bacterium]
MKEVLHIFCGPFPSYQGTQALVNQTCELSIKSGYKTTLLTYYEGLKKKSANFEIIRIADFPPFKSYKSGVSLTKAILDLSMALTIAKLIKKRRPHIIHAHHYEALIAVKIADPYKKIPLVFHQHAMFEPELHTYFNKRLSYFLKLSGRQIDKLLPAWADRIVTVSEYNRDKMIAHGYKKDKINVIYPAFSSNIETPQSTKKDKNSDNRIKGIYSGNLDSYQRIENLINALNILDKKYLNRLQIIINTKDNTEEILKQLTKDSRKSILIKPMQDFKHTARLISNCDFGIIPRSLPGGMPIKLVNYLEAGLPVIADIEILDSINQYHGVTGINTNDPVEFAETLKMFTLNSAFREEASAKTINAWKIFNKDEAKNKLHNAYRLILEE